MARVDKSKFSQDTLADWSEDEIAEGKRVADRMIRAWKRMRDAWLDINDCWYEAQSVADDAMTFKSEPVEDNGDKDVYNMFDQTFAKLSFDELAMNDVCEHMVEFWEYVKSL